MLMAEVEKVYRVEMKLVATAYIKATSPSAAMKIARRLRNQCPMVNDHGGDIPISGQKFDDPTLPEVSLSPAMTINGIWPGSSAELARG